MPDYFELENSFIAFRDKLEEYRKLCLYILRFPDETGIDEKWEEESMLRDSLTLEYGELQADIFGMAGYNSITIAGMKLDIFLSALDPLLKKDNLSRLFVIPSG